MDNVGGMNVIILVFILSFALDRIVKGALFLLSFVGPWARRFPEPATIAERVEQARAERKQKIVYVVLAAIPAIGILAYFGNVRILAGLNVEVDPVLDVVVTGLILIGGSDFVGRLLEMSGAYDGERTSGRPVEITGRLVLEEGADRLSGRSERASV